MKTGRPKHSGARLYDMGGEQFTALQLAQLAQCSAVAMTARLRRYSAAQAMGGAPMLVGDCRLEVEIVCSVPASWSQKKRAAALQGDIRPAKKPDSDNVIKAVCDGMNGVVWKDDVQAVEGWWRKTYGETPGVHVRVAALQAQATMEGAQA